MPKSFRSPSSVAMGFVLATALTVLTAGRSAAAEPGAPANKPLIGVGVDLYDTTHKEASISSLYYEAIEKSGGIPVLIPPMPKQDLLSVLSRLDGILMIGGMDYPPQLYGKQQEATTKPMLEERSQFDMSLAKEALATPSMPMLGICAGAQVMNINSGGTLLQDIPSHKPESKISHSSQEGWTKGFSKHEIKFLVDGKLAHIYGNAPPAVPSSHHQCVDQVAPGFKIVAEAPDGVPEAIEKDGPRFVIGVQWHPERDFEHNKALFAEFIKQAAEYHSKNDQVADRAR